MAGGNPPVSSDDLAPIKALIKSSSGLLFEEDKADLLRQSLASRMAQLRLGDMQAYLRQLEQDAEEMPHLLDLLTINETYFLREPEPLRLVAERLLPAHLSQYPGSPLRILCLGCSSGEEPYSLALAIAEAQGLAALAQVSIQGVDIDRPSLRRADEAIYGGQSFRALSAELLARYFQPLPAHSGQGPRRQLCAELRRPVHFQHLNLLDEDWPLALQGQDLVFFRNVSIYFDAATREAIQRRIGQILKPDGLLFLSSTETLSNNFGLLELVHEQGLFFFRNRPPKVPVAGSAVKPEAGPANNPATQDLAFGTRPSHGRLPRQSAPAAPSATADYEQALARVEQGDWPSALQLAQQLCQRAPEHSRHQRLLAVVLSQQEQFDAAEQAARTALAQDDLNPFHHFLLGRILRWQGRAGEALAQFRAVVFHRPDHWQAHYHLADLYRSQGQDEQAARSYRRVLQLLQQAPSAEAEPLMQALAAPPGRVIFLCQRHLQQLSEQEA
ncbi:MAG: tetratricopeptide repeat protein [Gammaproteobacteria bacterium SHHR-1]|uniref:CheR family methyltransferase n=1 Tax=Magnetovirga frankeli TaxID=947516 RepID=UPI001293854E|nr:tetratricopeptide repeat protein [gamma proteobacterium SS-5]